jgi:hypothetical protein
MYLHLAQQLKKKVCNHPYFLERKKRKKYFGGKIDLQHLLRSFSLKDDK